MDTATRQLIADKIRQYPGKTNDQIRSLLTRHGVKCSDVAEVRNGAAPSSQAKPNVSAPRPRVRSLADFRREHDIAQKIRDTIANLRADGYVTEEELRQLCEVPVQNWRRHAELPEFADKKFRLDGHTFWAAPATIKQMKQITGRA